MSFHSIHDPALYGLGTEAMGDLKDAGGMDGIAIANFVLGTPEENAPVATVLRMDPGYVLPRHGHNCWRFEVIVEGSIDVEGKTYGAGTVMFSAPNDLYGPHIAGPDGCTTIEIFSTFEASKHLLLEGESGDLVECDLRTSDGTARVMSLVAKQMERLGS